MNELRALPICGMCGRDSTRLVQTLKGVFLLCATCEPPAGAGPIIIREPLAAVSVATRVVKMGYGMFYDVDVSRAGKWGNPFVIGAHGSRATVIAKYRAWLLQQPQLLASLHELRGKVLGCYCAPLPCHGDVLVELADKCVAPPPRFTLPPLPKRFTLPALPSRKLPPNASRSRVAAMNRQAHEVIARQTQRGTTSKNVVKCVVDYTYTENESGNEQECVVVECGDCAHTEQSWGHGDKSVRRCLVLMGKNCPEDGDNFYAIEAD